MARQEPMTLGNDLIKFTAIEGGNVRGRQLRTIAQDTERLDKLLILVQTRAITLDEYTRAAQNYIQHIAEQLDRLNKKGA